MKEIRTTQLHSVEVEANLWKASSPDKLCLQVPHDVNTFRDK